jgi:hypothetical protein
MPTPSATTLSIGSSIANASTYATASVAGAANSLVLLAFANHATTQRSVSSVVGGGASAGWTSVRSINFSTIAAPLEEIDVWRYLTAAPAAASPITITLSGTASNGQWIITQFSNVSTAGTNGANAVAQSVSSRVDTASALTCILASFTSAVNVPFGSFSFSTTANNVITPGANFSELGETTSTEHCDVQSEWSTAQNTSVDAKLTAGTRNSGGIALEIVGNNAAAGGGARSEYYSHYYHRMIAQ